MNIVTGAPCSGKTTLCQSIQAVELSVSEAINKANELSSTGIPYTVIFLFCHKEILINRALIRHDQNALRHIAEIMEYHEPCIPQLRKWFEDFMVLHTDAGIDLSIIGALNASRQRRIEVSTSSASTPRLLQRQN